MRLWRMAKFAWREFRGFGHKEYEHVQSLRHNAENWIKASEAEAQSVARQQREAYSKTLELYKLAISTHDPSVVRPSDAAAKAEDRLGELAAMAAFQNDPRNQAIIKHIQEGKSVPEAVQLILTAAAKEAGSERSAVWERVQRELAKGTSNSSSTKQGSAGRPHEGKERDVK